MDLLAHHAGAKGHHASLQESISPHLKPAEVPSKSPAGHVCPYSPTLCAQRRYHTSPNQVITAVLNLLCPEKATPITNNLSTTMFTSLGTGKCLAGLQ
eukprot:1160338-Pelagomonas_calceolata.AAC.5